MITWLKKRLRKKDPVFNINITLPKFFCHCEEPVMGWGIDCHASTFYLLCKECNTRLSRDITKLKAVITSPTYNPYGTKSQPRPPIDGNIIPFEPK